MSFCLFCFVLSPDKVNKILPFELKTGKGFKICIFSIDSGSAIINFNDVEVKRLMSLISKIFL